MPEFSDVARDQVVHSYNEQGVYVHTFNKHIPPGVGLPGKSTDVAPLPQRSGFAVVINEDGETWRYEPDYRSTLVWDTSQPAAQAPVMLEALGPIPDGYTASSPGHSTDVWDDAAGAWNPDLSARRSQAVSALIHPARLAKERGLDSVGIDGELLAVLMHGQDKARRAGNPRVSAEFELMRASGMSDDQVVSTVDMAIDTAAQVRLSVAQVMVDAKTAILAATTTESITAARDSALTTLAGLY